MALYDIIVLLLIEPGRIVDAIDLCNSITLKSNLPHKGEVEAKEFQVFFIR